MRRWSVRRQLLLLVAVFVVPGSAVFAWLLAAEGQKVGEQARARVEQMAKEAAGRLDLALEEREDALRHLAARPQVRALDPERCDPLIREYILLQPEFGTLAVRDLEARPICTSVENAPSAAEVAAFPWFQQAVRATGLHVSGAFMGPQSGRWIATLSYPVIDARGAVGGLVIVATDLEKLQRRVLGTLPADVVVTAFDAAGRTAMRSRDFAQWAGRPAPAQPFAGARERRQGSGTVEGLDGVRRLYAYAPVPKADWLVTVGMLEADVFAEQRALQLRSAAVGAGVLVLVLLLAWRVSRAIVEPIHGLAETAMRVARGDTPARARPTGPDEISDVARQFNHMLDVRDRADQQRAQAEAALDQSRDRYLAIVENALDAVVQMDAAGLITGWNARAQTLFGWSAAQAIGRPLQETIIPPRFREAHRRGLARFATTGSGPMLDRLIEIDAQHRDGHTFPVELTITVLKIDTGNEFTAFIRDISGRRNAETNRLTLEAQLRESQKLEAVGTLAGGIAHDFNNILAAILGNVALAREELAPAHPATVNLEQVQKAASRARSLVQQILAFSRRQPQHLSIRPLAPLIRETAGLLRATLPAGAALELVLAEEPLLILSDATQIQQVLVNLCTNAWHALPDGVGRIEIGLAAAELESGTLRTGSLAAGSYAHLWVRDNGSGMDKATSARIFEPFFTTKAVGEGTGLGLSVVHGIVTTHLGSITVESEPGLGSTFHLYFPRAWHSDAIEPTMSAVLEATLPGGGEHVLYIDDDDVMALMAEGLLGRAGYRVTALRDPAEAIARVRDGPWNYDVVVTDFNMPGSSGIDVARELARLRADLPVLITSGLVTDGLREQARQAGIRAVMQKENSLEELVPLIRRVLTETVPQD